MSDTLRSRIAAVIANRATAPAHAVCGWSLDLADAVIADLGLRREVDDKASFRREPMRHRYVTSWGTDDE